MPLHPLQPLTINSMYPMTMSSTYIDKELISIQDFEHRVYMHLRRQLGLIPLPNEAAIATSSTSLPPLIPMRNPARGTHSANIQVDTGLYYNVEGNCLAEAARTTPRALQCRCSNNERRRRGRKHKRLVQAMRTIQISIFRKRTPKSQ